MQVRHIILFNPSESVILAETGTDIKTEGEIVSLHNEF